MALQRPRRILGSCNRQSTRREPASVSRIHAHPEQLYSPSWPPRRDSDSSNAVPVLKENRVGMRESLYPYLQSNLLTIPRSAGCVWALGGQGSYPWIIKQFCRNLPNARPHPSIPQRSRRHPDLSRRPMGRARILTLPTTVCRTNDPRRVYSGQTR